VPNLLLTAPTTVPNLLLTQLPPKSRQRVLLHVPNLPLTVPNLLLTQLPLLTVPNLLLTQLPPKSRQRVLLQIPPDKAAQFSAQVLKLLALLVQKYTY
jgi:hypothetical protein